MITVFAGAGASRAVSEQYPTTLEFFTQLPTTVTSNRLYDPILRRAKSERSDDVVDVEDLLFLLDDLSASVRSITSPDETLGWLLSGDLLNKVSGLNKQQLTTNAQALETLCTQLEEEFHKAVHDTYVHIPRVEALVR